MKFLRALKNLIGIAFLLSGFLPPILAESGKMLVVVQAVDDRPVRGIQIDQGIRGTGINRGLGSIGMVRE
jgi:hypothetical protein